MTDALPRAVFLSYASQDAEAAKCICDALRAAGVEVWFDQNELVGGDAWDAKIRRQIAECALFVPIISAHTQARLEGYFRLEWRIAAQRTHMMSEQIAFLLPVVIDDTRDAVADVPAEFKAVQWTRLRPGPEGQAPDGASTAAFCARVQRILAPAAAAPAALPPRPVAVGAATTRRAGLGLLWAGAFAVVAVGAGVYFLRARNPERSAVVAPPPATEAQRFIAQARQIIDSSDEIHRENLFLAEDLIKRALALEPANLDALLLGTRLSESYVWYQIDNSRARREQLMQQANRAVALAPQSIEARLARLEAQNAILFTHAGASAPPDLEKEARALVGLAPGNWRMHRILGGTLRFLGRWDESIEAHRRAFELSQGHPGAAADLVNVFFRARRYEEGMTVLRQALTGTRSARLLCWEVMANLRWVGDADAAREAVKTWPNWLTQEDRGIHHAWLACMWSRRPDEARRVASLAVRDMVRDFSFYGPVAALHALANEQSGNREAARADWRAVLDRCELELQAEPNNEPGLYWKAWALARLDRADEAKRIVAELTQRNQQGFTSFMKNTSLAPLQLLVGEKDAAFATLRRRLNSKDDSFGVTRAELTLDPSYAGVRNDPEFQALRDAAPAPVVDEKSAPADKSVAVLAFANLSDDKANEYFSDGISEELLNVLAKVPGLKVSARTSAFYFKGKDVPIPEIAKQLGVAYVVEGSVRKSGDKVRITAQLVKAADGFHVWSETFTRDVKDIFAVQDEIASVVARNLSLQLGVAARPAHQASAEAIALLTEGRHYWALRTKDGFARAGELYRQAIQLDPEWPRAHAALANLQVIEASFRSGDGEDMAALFAEAERNALRALSLDPDLADAYAALGKLATDRTEWGKSAEFLAKALARDPNNVAAHDWNADLNLLQGRLDLALAGYRRALELDPLSPFVLFDNTWALLHLRRFPEMRPLIERAIELTPGSRTRLTVRKAHVLLRLGLREESGAALRPALAALASGEDPAQISEAVWCLRELGWTRELDELTRAILSRPQPKFAKGVLLAAIGRAAEALPYLELATPIMRQVLYFDPALDAVRDTPEFRQVLRKLGCENEHAIARATLARMLREGAKP